MIPVRSNRELMILCHAATRKEDTSLRKDITPLPPLQYFSPDDITKVLIFFEDQTLYVIYPGTMGKPRFSNPSKVGFFNWLRSPIIEVKDWERDLDFTKKSVGLLSKNKRIKAHEGFVKEYQQTRDNILDIINKTCPALIVVAGYSQGGAHATLCFRDILYNYNIPTIGITFASPRVYNRYGALEFERELQSRPDCRFTRLVRSKDIVPHLAPWIFNFRHICPATVIGVPKWSFYHTVEDHYSSRYIEDL